MSRDRLTALDESFLHLEDANAHMHIASVSVFEGPPPGYDELLSHVGRRLHLVPRFRQKLAFVPYGLGRPAWVDDPHFNVEYHVRYTSLPQPGSEEQLAGKAGRVFATQLDRSKPLWEIWMVAGLEDDRFALMIKCHHCLVDGISGVDITNVLFDPEREPGPSPTTPPPRPWRPGPEPSGTELLAESLAGFTRTPADVVEDLRSAARRPRLAVDRAREMLGAIGALAWAGFNRAPHSPLNVEIGSNRRYTWVRAELTELKAIKRALGGTINDLVLTAVAGALGRFLSARGLETDGLVLKAMVPVSVRADAERGALGNQVTTMFAPLPAGEPDPVRRLALVREAMGDLKASGQAVGAHVLTDLTGFAPPTILSQAARLSSRQRFFNLVVTNVPGPQFPLFCLGRELLEIFPMVPLANRQALGIAVLSYNGHMNFGLLGDYDELADLDLFRAALEESLAELAEAARSGEPARV